MSFEAAKGLVRERSGEPVPVRTIVCPRCGGTNPATTKRCRACLTPLESSARTAPRVVTPVFEPRRAEMEAALGELEALTRDVPSAPPRYPCPTCGRSVDAAAARCACGAWFERRSEIVGYECPLCGARVSESATRCACGARFSA